MIETYNTLDRLKFTGALNMTNTKLKYKYMSLVYTHAS